MTKNLDARLDKLEAALMPPGVVVLARDGAETREECIRRSGYEPEARGMTFVPGAIASGLDKGEATKGDLLGWP